MTTPFNPLPASTVELRGFLEQITEQHSDRLLGHLAELALQYRYPMDFWASEARHGFVDHNQSVLIMLDEDEYAWRFMLERTALSPMVGQMDIPEELQTAWAVMVRAQKLKELIIGMDLVP